MPPPMRSRSTGLRARGPTTRLEATLAALLCLGLALLAQGAEFTHRHPAQIGCAEPHPDEPPHACALPAESPWLSAARPPQGPASPEICLVCRFSRGPLTQASAGAFLPAPPGAGPRAAISGAPDLSSLALPGFLTRAPPAQA